MKKLKEDMKRQGWTQHQLAAMLDMSPRQIRRYLSGQAPIPKVFWLALETLATRGAG